MYNYYVYNVVKHYFFQKWQRRWFVLFQHGALRYALDNNVRKVIVGLFTLLTVIVYLAICFITCLLYSYKSFHWYRLSIDCVFT